MVAVLGIAVALYLKNPGPANPLAQPAAEQTPLHADAALKAPSPAQPTPKEPSPPPAQKPQYAGPAARDTPAGDLPQAAQHAVMLESLGGLSAANLYQSYLNIGLLADGVQSETFTIEGAAGTLKIITN